MERSRVNGKEKALSDKQVESESGNKDALCYLFIKSVSFHSNTLECSRTTLNCSISKRCNKYFSNYNLSCWKQSDVLKSVSVRVIFSSQ